MGPPVALTRVESGVVLGILNQIVPDHGVWVFGSRAGSTTKPFSDLDLVVLGDQALSLQTLANLREAFSESDLPYRVDVVDWASTSDEFRAVILRQHVSIKEPGAAPKSPTGLIANSR